MAKKNKKAKKISVHTAAPIHIPKERKITRKVGPTIISSNNEKQIALDFAADIHKRFSDLVKATILFGSQAKNQQKPGSDIDLIIVIDDASINWDMELVSWYREELGKIIAKNANSVDLHVNTIKLTTWWADLMHGDPVIINVLRYGEALIDIGGFFNPLKALLLQGRIHSTPEAVYEALQRAPGHLTRSKAAEMGAIEGVYWSMIDSAQAALMTVGLLPPSPEHVTSMLKESFVDKNMLDIELVKWFRDIHSLHKDIIHGNVNNIRGAEIDVWQERAGKFMKKMIDIVDQILDSRKK